MALWRRPARGTPPAGLEGLLAALDRDQREAATAPPGPLLVIAGAGAGKTRTLIARAAYAVERVGIAPPAIVPNRRPLRPPIGGFELWRRFEWIAEGERVSPAEGDRAIDQRQYAEALLTECS